MTQRLKSSQPMDIVREIAFFDNDNGHPQLVLLYHTTIDYNKKVVISFTHSGHAGSVWLQSSISE